MNPVIHVGLILLLLTFIAVYIWLALRVFRYFSRRFHKSPTPYPADHAVALARVLRVIEIIAVQPDLNEVVVLLVDEGVGKVDAQLLVLFVPMALGFILLKQMGVDQFPNFYWVYSDSGKALLFPLEREHYFTAALTLAPEQLSQETLQTVVYHSAEMDAARKTFANGCDTLVGSRVGTPTIFAVTAEQITASRNTS